MFGSLCCIFFWDFIDVSSRCFGWVSIVIGDNEHVLILALMQLKMDQNLLIY